MTLDQLNELYLKYLQREPTPADIRTHKDKKYETFEQEISKCEEHKKLNIPAEKVSKLNGKIAILLSGHIRKNSVAAGLKKFFSEYDYDIFIHTWDNVGLKGKETNLDDDVQFTLVQNALKEFNHVKKVQVENNKAYVKSLVPQDIEYFNFSSDEPFIKSQLYSIWRSHKLMEEYQAETNQKYIMVIKLRFDTEIKSVKFNSSLISEINKHDIIFTSDLDCHHHDSQGDNDSAAGCSICNKMYYTYNLKEVHNFDHTNIICDFYAYGSEKAMKKYCSMYDEYDNFCRNSVEKNKSQYKKNPAFAFKCGNVYKIRDQEHNCKLKIEEANNRKSHIHALFYYHCSTPERLLQNLLKDYMCLKSTHFYAKTIR